MLEAVNIHLEAKGIALPPEPVVDATILQAPSLTKNATGGRDPEMHQTPQGQPGVFGAKGTHRRGLKAGHGSLRMHHCRLDVGQAHAASPAAWGRDQGVRR